jgi:hypothetical protein
MPEEGGREVVFSTYLPPCSPLLATSLPSSSHSYSLLKRREVMRWRIERNEGRRGGEDDWEEGGREVVRKTEGKEGESFRLHPPY